MTQTKHVMRDKLQKQVEIALKVARVAYWEYDVADEAFIFNDSAYDILRTTVEKEGGYIIPAADYIARFVHPDDAHILINEIRRAFKSTDPDFTSEHEYRAVWGDGQPGYLNILFKVERGGNGRVTRLYGTGQDITRRRKNEDALARRAAKTEALLNLTRVASGSLDLETILEEALKQALSVTGFEAGLISLADPETQSLALREHRLPKTLLRLLQTNGLDGTLCDLVYRRQEPVIVPDFSQGAPVDVTGLMALGFKSYQGVPVAAKGQVMGTLCLFSNTHLVLEEVEIDLLQAIGQQIGFAIRNAFLFQQTQSSETRYRTLFDSAADGIEVLDAQGFITDCNETYVSALGYSRNEIIGRHTTHFFASESAKLFKQLLSQIKKTGIAEGEVEIMRQDGSIMQVWRKAQAVFGEDDQITSIVTYNRDITERKLAEAALHEARSRSQIILDAVTTPLLISKLSDGQIIYANELLADLIQLPLEELIGNVTPDFYFDPTDRPKLLNLLREQGSATDYELQLKRGHGEPFWASISIKIFDFQGEAALITTFLDVTERKQTALALQQAQARSQFILESVTLPLLVSRIKDGTVVYANDRIAEMVGIAPEDVMGNQTPDFYRNPEDRAEILNAVREHGGIDNKELALKRADGTLLWAILSNRLVDFEGESAIITTLIDITARKEAEEALARRAAELEMVSRVSASAASILETDKLLQEVVDLTKDRFNLYHAHIYLLNAGGDALVLTAGAGDVGRQMVAEGRRIPLNQKQSLVAQAARTGQGVTENDARANPAFLPHPLLPDTRSEMAVPMIVGDRVIGVLDVQSDEIGRFTEQEVMISTTLAAQIAVALENARSFEQAQEAVANLNEITRRLTREGWQDYLNELPPEATGFVYDPSQLDPVLPVAEAGNGAVISEKVENGSGNDVLRQIAQTINVHGEAVGQLVVVPDEVDEQEVEEIVTAVSEQLSARIENIRLTDQTQTALAEAERQREELALINRVVADVSASLDIKHSLQIVADELAQAIDVDSVGIALINAEKTSLTVIAEHYDPTTSESGLGFVIPVEGNLLTQEALRTQRTVVVEDAQHHPLTAPIHDGMRLRGIHTLYVIPMLAGNEVVGTVGLDIFEEGKLLLPEQLELAETLIFQAATAVQNARLFDQTETALAETEALYQISAELNVARTYKEVLDSLYTHTILGQNVQNVSVNYFDTPWTDKQSPEWIEVLARITDLPTGATSSRYLLAHFPSAEKILHSDEPVAIEDISSDPRVDDNARALYMQQFGAKSTIFVPLLVGEQQIGYINAIYQQPMLFSKSVQRQLMVLSRQAAVAVQGMRLLENTRQRAEREQRLREIAEKVRSSADVETIMRTAVQEAGRILGRRTFIYLEEQPSAQE